MEELTVKIKPLTPIWTGDETGKCETLRETGLLGSLRWWYEALIRGLGGSACDPTNSKCEGKNHCDACELFGCKGWARKFRLEVEFNSTIIPKVWIGIREKRGNKYLKRNVAGLMSDETLIMKFIPLREISQNEWVLLNKTLKIIADYGAFGAHTSQGNGMIEVIESNLSHKDRNSEKPKWKKSGIGVESPNLNNFFFYKFRFKFNEDLSNLIDNEVFWTHASDHNGFKDDWEKWRKLWGVYHFLPIASHIRDAIRHLEDDKNKRHKIFGELGEGSKVFVSHGYEIDDKTVEVRIWGYDVEENIKNEIMEELENKLKEKLFSRREYRESLESCSLTEEKAGKEILEGLG